MFPRMIISDSAEKKTPNNSRSVEIQGLLHGSYLLLSRHEFIQVTHKLKLSKFCKLTKTPSSTCLQKARTENTNKITDTT